MASTIDLARGYRISDDSSLSAACATTEVHPGWSRGWLARLELPTDDAQDQKYGCHRAFLRAGQRRTSRAGNGTLTYDHLEPGIYEADSVYRSYASWRAYFEVSADGSIRWIGSNQSSDRALSDAMDRVRDLAHEDGAAVVEG